MLVLKLVRVGNAHAHLHNLLDIYTWIWHAYIFTVLQMWCAVFLSLWNFYYSWSENSRLDTLRSIVDIYVTVKVLTTYYTNFNGAFFIQSGAATSSEGSCFSEGEDGKIWSPSDLLPLPRTTQVFTIVQWFSLLVFCGNHGYSSVTTLV